jgi:predicted Zn-dependent protease
MLSRRHFCGMSACALALGVGGGCTLNPATGRQDLILIGGAEEKALGAREHPKILAQFGGVYNDRAAAGYVAVIGGRLAAASESPNLGFTFTLLDSPIVNAFALPGGFIYISRGLMALAEDEAELAGVLGHEIGHVVARHSAQRRSRALLAQLGAGLLGALGGGAAGQLAGTAAGLYLRSYSRDQEFEADMLGIRYLRRAGYDVNAMASFLTKLRANSRLEAKIAGRSPDKLDAYDITATHPRTVARVRQAAALAGDARPGAARRERAAFFKVIDGMVFGDGAEQGYVLGRRFAHPKLRFEFTVPPGFQLRNTPEQVEAESKRDQVQIVFDQARQPYLGAMTAYIRQRWAHNVPVSGLEAIVINGFPAATGTVRGRADNRAVEIRLIAIRYDSRRVFRFTMIGPPPALRRLATALQRMTYSFRRLSVAQAAALEPKRLRIVAAGPDATPGNFAPRMAFATFRRERFAVLNGLGGGGSLAGRKRVKIVTRRVL